MYVNIYSPGPLIIGSFPISAKGLPPRRRLLPELTKLMQRHGLRRKDLYGLDMAGLPDPREADTWDERTQALARNLQLAFVGDPTHFSAFWLYTWTDRGFVLSREPTT